MALRAGFDPARIYLHGNNKTEAELRHAVDAGVGHVIVDSFDEIARLDAILDRPQDVLIRVTPGIRPAPTPTCRPASSTRSSASGSRMGWRRRAVAEVGRRATCDLVGLHAHIGSQIFELEPYAAAIEALAELADGDWECRILNVGGGLGIAYTSEPIEPPSIEDYVEVKVRRRRARLRPGAADPDRARALAGRQRRRDRLHGRHRQGDPGRAHLSSRSTAACPTTCARCSTARATRR